MKKTPPKGKNKPKQQTKIQMPKTVYHYCSLETFHKIMINATLRLSDIDMTNDYEERKVLKKWINRGFKQYQDSGNLEADIINEIIIGPKCSMWEDDIKRFLCLHGYDKDKIKIYKSKCTYR